MYEGFNLGIFRRARRNRDPLPDAAKDGKLGVASLLFRHKPERVGVDGNERKVGILDSVFMREYLRQLLFLALTQELDALLLLLVGKDHHTCIIPRSKIGFATGQAGICYTGGMTLVQKENLQGLVKEVLAKFPNKNTATVLALVGELGAGKTTFVQVLAKELGVVETVQSPTYVLMKKYQIPNFKFQTLIHVDAYRLEKPEEFTALNPEEFLKDPSNLVCIEWPERVEGALPKPDMVIKFSSEAANEGERYIHIENPRD